MWKILGSRSVVSCALRNTYLSGMYNKKFLFFISLLHVGQGVIERDLLLTRNEGIHTFGRTLIYNPKNNETSGIVPWEQTLKHVTFLTLFGEAGRSSNISDIKEYTKFMQSPYIRIHEEYPRFGDIITIARGRLEKSNGYLFVEGNCEERCGDKLLAMWRVQKIRHRDPQRGFRYEMKFSVTPLDSETGIQSKHTLNEQYVKSFIMKDDDYPENFNALTRRSDNMESFLNERQGRIINEIPHLPHLNIGEYFKEVPKASSKVGYLSNVYPTTYRPNFSVKFPKPNEFEAPEEPKTVVTHHFHHHYFMKDSDSSHQQLYPDAIQLIDAPNAKDLSPNYEIKVPTKSYTTTTTTEAPPQPAVFYMHPIPLYIHSFPRDETTERRQVVNTTPFKQSEQQFDEVRYSEPDPLYENVDNIDTDTPRSYSESVAAEIHPQVETPEIFANRITAQLPDPEDIEDTKAPTTQTPTTYLTRKTLLPKNKYFISTSTTESTNKLPAKTSLHKLRNYSRTTTEQPVLKWKPKRKPKEHHTTSERPDSGEVQSSTEEKVITVTPSKVDVAEYQVLTEKSVSKSVSVKVGNHSEEISLPIETGTTVSSLE